MAGDMKKNSSLCLSFVQLAVRSNPSIGAYSLTPPPTNPNPCT
jgi:hypothetical protein